MYRSMSNKIYILTQEEQNLRAAAKLPHPEAPVGPSTFLRAPGENAIIKISNSGSGVRTMTQFWSAFVIFACCFRPSASAQEIGSSPSGPAPAGTAISAIIECGEGYTSHELYDAKITLLEVIRGDEAGKRLRQADSANKPAEPGTEYVLAKVKFEYYARGVPGLCIHHVLPEQFAAYTSGGDDYKAVSAVTPKPELRKELKSGESAEGWLVFAISKDDRAPLLSYSADAGGAVQHGGSKWFLLR